MRRVRRFRRQRQLHADGRIGEMRARQCRRALRVVLGDRPQDLLILTSDHGCDPTTPSTDHSREHALLLAYVEGKNAGGRIHEGEFADVGATVSRWLGAKAPSRGIPGQPIVEH